MSSHHTRRFICINERSKRGNWINKLRRTIWQGNKIFSMRCFLLNLFRFFFCFFSFGIYSVIITNNPCFSAIQTYQNTILSELLTISRMLSSTNNVFTLFFIFIDARNLQKICKKFASFLHLSFFPPTFSPSSTLYPPIHSHQNIDRQDILTLI